MRGFVRQGHAHSAHAQIAYSFSPHIPANAHTNASRTDTSRSERILLWKLTHSRMCKALAGDKVLKRLRLHRRRLLL